MLGKLFTLALIAMTTNAVRLDSEIDAECDLSADADKCGGCGGCGATRWCYKYDYDLRRWTIVPCDTL